MPKITADTVAEHIAQQEAAVIAAASACSPSGGRCGEPGDDRLRGRARPQLALPLLPRQGPHPAAWFRAELAPLQDASTTIATASEARPTSGSRPGCACTSTTSTAPEHQLFASIAASIGTLSAEVREAVIADHRQLYATVDDIVADALRLVPRGRGRARRGGRRHARARAVPGGQ